MRIFLMEIAYEVGCLIRLMDWIRLSAEIVRFSIFT